MFYIFRPVAERNIFKYIFRELKKKTVINTFKISGFCTQMKATVFLSQNKGVCFYCNRNCGRNKLN